MGKLVSYIYIVPLILALLSLAACFSTQRRKYRTYMLSLFRGRDYRSYLSKTVEFCIPHDSKISRFYRNRVLKYSKLRFEKLVLIKFVLFFAVIVIAMMVKYTNISMQTREILTRFDYYTDLLYEHKGEVDEQQALHQEIEQFNLALQNIKRSEFTRGAEEIQEMISGLIIQSDTELLLPRRTLVNKVYYRLKDYYEIRELNLLLYVFIALWVSFTPELCILIKNVFDKSEAKRELRFLKKLIIMNGSIKPVDFREVLTVMIDKSKHYKKVLLEIEDKNKRNSTDSKSIYSAYIKGTKELDVKLFFEKLDEANNYDFDQAIKNIENEFKLEKREDVRRIRKRIELIHVVGITGFMIIIFISVLYLIEPWLRMYNMNRIGI